MFRKQFNKDRQQARKNFNNMLQAVDHKPHLQTTTVLIKV